MCEFTLSPGSWCGTQLLGRARGPEKTNVSFSYIIKLSCETHGFLFVGPVSYDLGFFRAQGFLRTLFILAIQLETSFQFRSLSLLSIFRLKGS